MQCLVYLQLLQDSHETCLNSLSRPVLLFLNLLQTMFELVMATIPSEDIVKKEKDWKL